MEFIHRISASNAISAPLTWQQGDLRRPYPTDIEMRLGYLGKSDLSNVNGHSSQSSGSGATSSDFPKPTIGGQFKRDSIETQQITNWIFYLFRTDIPMASQNQFAWMQSGELHMTMGKSSNAASVPLDTRYVYSRLE